MPQTDIDRTAADRARQLETLDRLSTRFGESLSAAFEANLEAAREFDGVLGTLADKLSGVAYSAAMTPVRSGVENLVKSVLGARAESGALGFARGGVIAEGLQRFASGGVVGGPTLFPMRNGTGLMGENGPEAILPLQRGSDGRLGVAGGGERPISVTLNVSTPDADSFRRSEAQVAASLSRALARGRRAL